MDTTMLLEVITGLTLYALATVVEKYIRSYNGNVWEELNKED